MQFCTGPARNGIEMNFLFFFLSKFCVNYYYLIFPNLTITTG